jgi:hypothetical protein
MFPAKQFLAAHHIGETTLFQPPSCHETRQIAFDESHKNFEFTGQCTHIAKNLNANEEKLRFST